MKKAILSLLFLALWTVTGVAILPAADSAKAPAQATTQVTSTTATADEQCNQEGLFARIECLKRTSAARTAKHCAEMRKMGFRSLLCE